MVKKIIRANLTNEGEQALIRVTFLGLILAYLAESGSALGVLACGLYMAYSTVFLLLILKFPKHNEKRQWWALMVDIGMASYGTYITGSAGGIFIGLFLWLIIGYGLRYGEKYTIVAFLATLVGYTLSMQFNPYWLAHRDVVNGFFLTLILVPVHTFFLQRKLEKAVTQAKHDSEAKSRFLSHMSHEIRTPLNGIVGATDLLSNTELNSEQRNAMYHIKNSAILLRQLVNDVLDISKIEQGKMDLHIADFDLVSLVNDVDMAFRNQAENKKLQFNCVIEEDCPTQLIGDALHIKQIILNLVGNAIKFTHEGSVNLLIKQIEGEATTLLISVKDTGIGIKQAKLGKIFESFTQADASITDKFGGTGLGTTIAKNLVELMGGKISVQSEVGVGSEFTVMIRLQRQIESSAVKPMIDNVVSFQAHASRFKKHTILIADDNLTNRYILNALLTQAGYIVHEAEDGDKALDMLEVMSFDLMMLDLNMPKLSGLEVIDIHRRLSSKTTPSVIITADATLETKQKCLDMGVDSLLTKPYDTAKLLDTVKLLITGNQVEAITVIDKEQPTDTVLNLAKFQELKSISKDPQFLVNLISGFVGDTTISLKAMHRELNKQEYQAVRDLAHAVKGNAGSLGADLIFQSCTQIESLNSTDNNKTWAKALKQADAAWHKTKIALMAQIEQSKAI